MSEADHSSPRSPPDLRQRILRFVVLSSACCLSIGHHYGNYLLGPLKREILERMHGSEVDFATLISAFALVNSVTPLIGNIIPRLGLPWAALLAAFSVCLGQVIILFGSYYANVPAMIVGYLINGLGTSPLAVVQETIILKSTQPNQRGKSLSAALFFGKLATWLGSITAAPLSSSPILGPSTPFLASSFLSCFSLLAALSFAVAFTQLMNPEWAVRESRIVPLTAVVTFGDSFWVYVALCAASGALWFPFIHQSTDLLATLYSTTSARAAIFASLALFTCLLLYPLYGITTDSKLQRPYLQPRKLLPVCTVSTIISLVTLEFPASRQWFGIGGSVVGFAIGRGLAPLLLVMVVPELVEPEMIGTALGIHKAVEMAAASLIQLVTSIILEGEDPTRLVRAERTILLFICINILEFLFALTLSQMKPTTTKRRDSHDGLTEPLSSPSTEDSLLTTPLRTYNTFSERTPAQQARRIRHWNRQRRREHESVICRGTIGFGCSTLLIVSSWIAFITALVKR